MSGGSRRVLCASTGFASRPCAAPDVRMMHNFARPGPSSVAQLANRTAHCLRPATRTSKNSSSLNWRCSKTAVRARVFDSKPAFQHALVERQPAQLAILERSQLFHGKFHVHAKVPGMMQLRDSDAKFTFIVTCGTFGDLPGIRPGLPREREVSNHWNHRGRQRAVILGMKTRLSRKIRRNQGAQRPWANSAPSTSRCAARERQSPHRHAHVEPLEPRPLPGVRLRRMM